MTYPRIELAGGIHHVVARSTFRRPLFLDDRDRQLYLQRWANQARKRGWTTYSFCLLPNHVHLVVKTPEEDLGDGIGVAHWEYARHLNEKVGAKGHLFDDRFKNKLVLSDLQMRATLRYVARNPIPSLCGRAEDHAWSAHNALAGTAVAPSWLGVGETLGWFDDDPTLARAAYVGMVAKSDNAVMAALAAAATGDAWLIAANDLHRIPIESIAAFLGRSVATTYRRLATARENERTVT